MIEYKDGDWVTHLTLPQGRFLGVAKIIKANYRELSMTAHWTCYNRGSSKMYFEGGRITKTCISSILWRGPDNVTIRWKK